MRRTAAIVIALLVGIVLGYTFASQSWERRLHTAMFASGCQRLTVAANVLQNLPADARPQTRRLLELDLRQALMDTSRAVPKADESVVSVFRSGATSEALSFAAALASEQGDGKLLRQVELVASRLKRVG